MGNFNKLDSRCDKFVTLCDIHGIYLFSSATGAKELKCCGDFFNPEPFFVNTGTCFTSNREVWEKWPYAFSLIKIWLNTQTSNSPSRFPRPLYGYNPWQLVAKHLLLHKVSFN